ncbi:MAG: hypothetical protein U1A78_17075 [Polyangia bacterium]
MDGERGRARPAYSVLTYALLLAVAAPLVVAVNVCALLDFYPWFLLLAVGLGLAAAGRGGLRRVQGAVSRRLAARLGVDVAHAPGGWLVWAAVPAWTVALGVLLNGALDRSAPAEHASVVLRVSGGKSPRVYLRDYRTSGATLSLRRSHALVGALRPGQAVTLEVRRGLFGWPYLTGIR